MIGSCSILGTAACTTAANMQLEVAGDASLASPSEDESSRCCVNRCCYWDCVIGHVSPLQCAVIFALDAYMFLLGGR